MPPKRTAEQIKADSAARKAAKNALETATKTAAKTPFNNSEAEAGSVTSINTAPLTEEQRQELLTALDKGSQAGSVVVELSVMPREAWIKLARLGLQLNLGMGEWRTPYTAHAADVSPCLVIALRASDSVRLPGLQTTHHVPPGDDPQHHLITALGLFLDEADRYLAARTQARNTIAAQPRPYNRSPLTPPPDDVANADPNHPLHPLDPSHPRHIRTGSSFSEPLTGVPLRAPKTGLEPAREGKE